MHKTLTAILFQICRLCSIMSTLDNVLLKIIHLPHQMENNVRYYGSNSDSIKCYRNSSCFQHFSCLQGNNTQWGVRIKGNTNGEEGESMAALEMSIEPDHMWVDRVSASTWMNFQKSPLIVYKNNRISHFWCYF